MGKIVDKTKEYYKDIEGAKYLVFEDEKIPENVEIFGSNVVMTGTGKLKVGRFVFHGDGVLLVDFIKIIQVLKRH